MDFPGTMTIRPEVMLNYLFDIGCSFARQGFERIVLVNGHGSNRPICELATQRITNQLRPIAPPSPISTWSRM